MNNISKRRRKNYLDYKSLDTNRQTGKNHPTMAYVIMGHGIETNELCTVPKGCMLVVEVHSGEINFNPVYNEFYKEPKDIFLNPIDNYKEVVNRISHKGYVQNIGSKTLAIYREGDTYYDFKYELMQYWLENKRLKIKEGEIRLNDSGIIEYPFTYIPPDNWLLQQRITESVGLERPIHNLYNMDASVKILLDKYRMSIYPSQEGLTAAFGNTQTIGHLFNNIINAVSITQSNLFKHMPPGIFYNLVCRGTRENIYTIDPNTGLIAIRNNVRKLMINRSLYNSPSLSRNSFGSHITTHFMNTNASSKSLRQKNKKNTTARRTRFFNKVIERQINEAEQHRKPYIKYLQLNRGDVVQDYLGLFSVDYFKVQMGVERDKCIPTSYFNELTDIYTKSYSDTEWGLEIVTEYLKNILLNPISMKDICDESHKQILIDAYVSLQRFLKVKMDYYRVSNRANNRARQYIKGRNGKWVVNSDPIGPDDRA